MNKLLALSLVTFIGFTYAQDEPLKPSQLTGTWSCTANKQIEGTTAILSETITVNEKQAFTVEGKTVIKMPKEMQKKGLPKEIFINYKANGTFLLKGNKLTTTIEKRELTKTNHPAKEMLKLGFGKPNAVEKSTISVLSDTELKHKYDKGDTTYDCKKKG